MSSFDVFIWKIYRVWIIYAFYDRDINSHVLFSFNDDNSLFIAFSHCVCSCNSIASEYESGFLWSVLSTFNNYANSPVIQPGNLLLCILLWNCCVSLPESVFSYFHHLLHNFLFLLLLPLLSFERFIFYFFIVFIYFCLLKFHFLQFRFSCVLLFHFLVSTSLRSLHVISGLNITSWLQITFLCDEIHTRYPSLLLTYLTKYPRTNFLSNFGIVYVRKHNKKCRRF